MNEQEELDEKLQLLKQYLEEGKLQIVENLHVIESLERVRYSPDGHVDPSTVDGSVRNMANMISFLKYEDDLRKIPLRRVQEEYFRFLETFFSNPYNEMIKHNLTLHQIATSMSRKESLVKAFAHDAQAFEEGITEFWKTFEDVVRVHVQDLKGLNSVYGGDIFPSYKKNTLAGTGLYIDTIILPDPMLRVASFMKYMKPEKGVYYMAKHALSALSIKDLILADVNPPIAVITPDPFILDENVQKFIQKVGTNDLLDHLGKAFDKNFKEEAELDQFLSKINNLEQLKKELKNPKRILFDTDWDNLTFDEQWKKSQKLNSDLKPFEEMNIGLQVKMTMIGRMMQIDEIIFKADSLNAVPLIDAPTSWRYLQWKYEHDKEEASRISPKSENVLVVNALQSERLLWLGNVPKDVLIQFRKEGVLSEFRNLFNKGIKDIEVASEKDYSKTVDSIISNINNAFYDHMELLRKQSAKNKNFLLTDVTPFIVEGGVSIAALSAHNVPMAIASSLIAGKTLLVGSKGGADLWKKGKELLNEKEKLRRSPVGILFEARKGVYNKSS